VRARLTLPAGLSDEEMKERVLADQAVQKHIAGKSVKKIVVAKGPLVSVVIG
jgi:leucyl-tRNA synthetase